MRRSHTVCHACVVCVWSAGEYIYWTDWQKRSIERIDKHTGREHTIIIDQLPDLMGLKAVNVSLPLGQSVTVSHCYYHLYTLGRDDTKL